MRKDALALLLCLFLFATSVSAQTVAQGSAGDPAEPWFVTGSFSFTAPQHIICDSGCTPGGSFLDNATFTFGTTAIGLMGAVVDDTATNTVTENSAGAPRMSTSRILYSNLRFSDGTSLLGQQTMTNSLPVVIASDQSLLPISAASLPLPTGAATAALQTQPGVDIGDVTVNNAAGAAAVNVQDGGNSITTDTVDVTTSGTITSTGGVLELTNLNGISTVTVQSTGGLSGSPSTTFQVSNDGGTTWVDLFCWTDSLFQWTNTFLLPGYNVTCSVSGWQRFRTLHSGGTTGSTGVYLRGSTGATKAVIVGGSDGSTVRRLKTDSTGELQVDVLSSALPTGAATAALQTQPGVDIGDVTINNASIAVTAAALPLPAGASTSAIQTDGTQKAQIVDSGGTVVNATGTSLDVNLRNATGDEVTVKEIGVTGTRNLQVHTGVTNSSAFLSDHPLFPVAGYSSGTWTRIEAATNQLFSATASGLIVRQHGYPDAAATTDDYTNPTVTGIQTFNMVWDGAAWDRQPGNSTDGLLVNLGANNDVTVTGTVAATQSGTWTVQPGNTQNTTPWLVKEQRAATPAVTSVADQATTTTCLASNVNRLGATVYNDSAADLYAKLGATASTTSFTVKIFQDGFFTVPFGYTGIIDCIWASDTAGSARVTEVVQ